MRIEFGFQSNCSELVTHLGMVKRDEVIKAMKSISELVGWTWGIWIHSPNIDRMVPIPKVKLGEVLRIDRRKKVTQFGSFMDSEQILSIWKDLLDESTETWLREEAPPHLLEPVLYDGPEDRIMSTRPRGMMSMGVGHEGKKGLTLCMGHGDVEMMPQFQAITRKFDSDFFGYDGGNDYVYAGWLAYHFMPEEGLKLVDENHKDVEKKNQTIAYLKAYPPLVESSQLTKREQEAISRLKDFTSDLKKFREKWDKKRKKRSSRWWSIRRK